ncbi:MAG: M48 family metalloprotease [Nannocystales bacterium]
MSLLPLGVRSATSVRIRTQGLVCALLLLCSCRYNPATEQVERGLVSEEQEVALGETLDREIRASVHVYGGSSRLTGLTRRIGHRLARQSERPELPWKFRLLDDPGVNAFALPGGIVYITRGLVTHLNSEAELAAVLSHEIAHVTALHGSIAIRDRERGWRWGGWANGELDLGQGAVDRDQLRLLAHSRERELEADRLALRYLRRAGYPPEAMAGVISLLSRLDVSAGRVPAWSRTHPSPRARAQALTPLLENDPDSLPWDNEYVRALEGSVFGSDPRNGWLENNEYRHGHAGFGVQLPVSWTKELVAPAVFAASADEKILLVAAPLFFSDPTVERVLAQFSNSRNLTLYDRHEYTVGGLPVTRARFRSSEEPVVSGIFQLAQSREGVITIMAVGLEADWAAHEVAVATVLNSQRLLSDADRVALQPGTISVVAATQGQTLRMIAVDPQELPILRRINRVTANEVLDEGRLIKRVPGALASAPPARPPASVTPAPASTASEPELKAGTSSAGTVPPFAH